MSRKVLIVDDSKVARMMHSRMIKEISADWEIVEAEDGTQAIDLAKKTLPDAIIIDFNMPGIDGLETAKQLLDATAGVQITMLTANIQNAVKERADGLGVGFLTKPVEKDDLAAFLEG